MNHLRKIKVVSLVTTDKSRPGVVSNATFDAVQEEGRTAVVLDRDAPADEAPGRCMVLRYLPERVLSVIEGSERSLSYRHTGEPIELWDYMEIPKERQGFWIHP